MNVQINKYRPYGLPIPGWDLEYQGNDYKYGGKEFDIFQKVNFYDFGARTYVPDESRFWQPDPMAGDYHWLSPYAYCAGDPINKGLQKTYIPYDYKQGYFINYCNR